MPSPQPCPLGASQLLFVFCVFSPPFLFCELEEGALEALSPGLPAPTSLCRGGGTL